MQKTLSVINLRAIRENALKIRARLENKTFFAVVKADAYGHGAVEVARYIEDIADYFCVAIIEEGIALRVAGIQKPILVLTPPLDGYDIDRAGFYSLELTVNSVDCARLVKDSFCHIKVNTGMNRYGCNVSELNGILKLLKKERIKGIYSHMYAPENVSASMKQLAIFDRAESIAKEYNPGLCAHLSASGGLLRGGSFLKDGARCGILLYGYAPSGFSAAGFTPALKVYARRAQVTRFIGGGVGYNAATRSYKNLSVYRLGYADGFFRNVPLGEKTLCMDAFIREGGEALFPAMINAEEYARRAGTIPYEILTSATRRSERIYER